MGFASADSRRAIALIRSSSRERSSVASAVRGDAALIDLTQKFDRVDLAKGDFLNPTTAQKLGKGLGAAYVVVGSYSVVDGTFLLDARLVNVESGAVTKAARLEGTRLLLKTGGKSGDFRRQEKP